MRLSVHFGRWWLYIADHRLRKRQERDINGLGRIGTHHKQRLIRERECRCERCGKEYDYRELEVHHVFQPRASRPWCNEDWNLRIYCKRCHKAVHNCPEQWVAERRAVAKAHNIKL